MSTGCYDRPPTPPRHPIVIAGELVRRGDKLSIEAAKCIKELEQFRAERAARDARTAEIALAHITQTGTRSTPREPVDNFATQKEN